MERRVVDPNSVQAQFATLNRDRDAFRNAAEAADRQRVNEEKLLRNLRSTQTELLEKLRFAHSKLGEEDKQRNILRDEENRLKQSLKEDKNEIIRLTSQLEGLEAEDKAQKKAFIKENNGLNKELNKEIKIYRERLVIKVMTVNILRILLNTKLADEVKWEEQQNQGVEVSLLKWRSLSDKLYQSLEVLETSTDKYTNEMTISRALESEKHILRTKMIENGQDKDEPLGDMELDELERLWEEASQVETIECKHDADQDIEDVRDGRRSLPQAVAQEHISMSLFYGNNENDPISMEY